MMKLNREQEEGIKKFFLSKSEKLSRRNGNYRMCLKERRKREEEDDRHQREEELRVRLQIRFNEKYITGREIATRLGISKSKLNNLRVIRKLPFMLRVNNGGIFIWERERIEPYIKLLVISYSEKSRGKGKR